jgi:hypothetical protein
MVVGCLNSHYGLMNSRWRAPSMWSPRISMPMLPVSIDAVSVDHREWHGCPLTAFDIRRDVARCRLRHRLRWIAGLRHAIWHSGLANWWHDDGDTGSVDLQVLRVPVAVVGRDAAVGVAQAGCIADCVDPLSKRGMIIGYCRAVGLDQPLIEVNPRAAGLDEADLALGLDAFTAAQRLGSDGILVACLAGHCPAKQATARSSSTRSCSSAVGRRGAPA